MSGLLEETDSPPLPPSDSACIGSGSYNRIITDTLIWTSGRNLISSLGGDDRIHGYDNSDVMRGGLGNDGITGGSGKDFFLCGDGTDTQQTLTLRLNVRIFDCLVISD